MKVLLSIKPEFALRIFNGTKHYEFRKVIFRKPDIKTVIVYASSPIKKIIGEFEIEEIISESPEILWRRTGCLAGISKKFFFNYFAERNVGYAIKIKQVYSYQKPECLRMKYNIYPPQSFCYVS